MPPAQSSASAAQDPRRVGGTLRVLAGASTGTLDPQVAYLALTKSMETPVYDTLLTYPKFAGPDAQPVIANLAQAVPMPEDGGLTYRLTLREGLHFSDGRPVGVDDVAASFRRMFKVGSPTAGPYYSRIIGADLCLKKPETCTLEGGMETDAQKRSITFHLRRPDPEFLDHLAWIHSVILPADTPPHDMGDIPPPGTGPYRITHFDATTGMRLERNAYFHEWAHDAQPAGYPDRIEITFGLDSESEVSAVESGQADWMYDNVPLDRLGEVGSRYTGQVHIYRLLLYYFAMLNVNEPPFNSLKVRQALNYAINRHAMAIYGGGPAISAPLCQLLPEGTPGYEPFCFYTRGASPQHPATTWQKPDMERARELVRESGTAGEKVVIVVPSDRRSGTVADELRGTLDALGYKASVHFISSAIHFTFVQNTNNHVQISLGGWNADYPSASSFLNTLFSCDSFHPGSDNSPNMAGFCNREIDGLMDHASDLSLTDRAASEHAWAQVDRALMEQAPAVPMVQTRRVVLLSKRVRNVIVTLNDEILLSQLQVQ
ncbi:ABC transporter substrate-binding protein [Acetobacter sp. TBRC 12305]|uniref:ABC transporter substrate-binding protein n=1 Tax=Acetobacter garciniae TaxID=2817435 RepID=A0A939HPU2_9PROT|nr:ABC transporter substrate-binding protein [Acetobacter garciniae]MBO1325803.1 ABC transporter substrate-binding protein [Acetobacter garciniae]MBX0345703.1 ABC transporter substrate-binding protein [Acetobacter garciniae]